MGVINCYEGSPRQHITERYNKWAGRSETRTAGATEGGSSTKQTAHFARCARNSHRLAKHTMEFWPTSMSAGNMLLPLPVEELNIVPAVRTMQSLRKQDRYEEADSFAEAITVRLLNQRVPLTLEEVEAVWNGFPKMSRAVSRLIIHLSRSRICGELFDLERIQQFVQKNRVLQDNLSLCCKELMEPGSDLARMAEEIWMANEGISERSRHRAGKRFGISWGITGRYEVPETFRGFTMWQPTGRQRSVRLTNLAKEGVPREMVKNAPSKDEDGMRRRDSIDTGDAKTVTMP